MKKAALLLTIIFFCMPADAAPSDFTLAKRAIELSAHIDAYGEYCKKQTTLAQDYLKRFKDEGMDQNKLKALEAIQTQVHADNLAILTEGKEDCKNVQFMLKRLEVTRSLKDVSYQLNGVDPSTVKDSIPPLEMLAPSTPPDIPLSNDEDAPQHATP